jgi:hypothetical protein
MMIFILSLTQNNNHAYKRDNLRVVVFALYRTAHILRHGLSAGFPQSRSSDWLPGFQALRHSSSRMKPNPITLLRFGNKMARSRSRPDRTQVPISARFLRVLILLQRETSCRIVMLTCTAVSDLLEKRFLSNFIGDKSFILQFIRLSCTCDKIPPYDEI